MPALTIEQALQYAVERHAAGSLREAEGIYRQVLAQQPGNVEAKNLLGRLALDCGNARDAAILIGEAVRAVPGEARYQISWSLVRQAQGDMAGAVSAAHRAVEVAPAYAPGRLHLGLLLDDRGDLAGAEAEYRAAVAVAPRLANAHNDLGILLDKMGRRGEAIVELRAAVELEPKNQEAQCNLALLLAGSGDHIAAVAILREVLEVRPDSVRALRLLGASLGNLGQLEEAVRAQRKAVELQPKDALAHNGLGIVLWQNRDCDRAMDEWRTAIRLNPKLGAAYHHLGVACLTGNEIEEAYACYSTLLELEPGNAWHHNNLAAALKAMGEHEAALAKLREAVELDPTNSHIHSGLICAAQFHPGYDAKMILEECANWERRHGEPLRASIQPHENSREPSRRLRIGYVSPNFWQHVVGRNILPLLEHHDHEQFEIFCYADMRIADDLTQEFQRHADQWRNTLHMTDEAVAQMVRSDGIDILVDLNLHLANDRLPVFARRPAPVQVTFAGYPGTTGLRKMDYRLTDPYLDPPGENDGLYAEESFRLPHSFWCYTPREDVAIGELPASSAGVVTFGCLNNFIKTNEPVQELWGRVLQAVPGSRLALLAPEGRAQKRVTEVLARQGIEPGRLEFLPKTGHREYLEYYQRVDIMLDTFPYNGHTTSLDALWMGVPVITLAGNHAVARAGVSQLTNLGLPELIADSEEAYVDKAAGLASELDRLGELRRTLRRRMEASVLMDAVEFTRGIEAAYRTMWGRWCGVGSIRGRTGGETSNIQHPTSPSARYTRSGPLRGNIQ